MNNSRYPVIVTSIADTSIHSVLDNGFFRESEMAPIVHAHASYELLMATTGELCVAVHHGGSKDTVILKESSAYLIPPGVYHCTNGVTGSARKLAVRFNCLKSKSEDTDGSVFSKFDSVLARCTSPVRIENATRLAEIIDEIRKELSSADMAAPEYVRILLNQLYVHLFRELDMGQTKAEAHVPSGEEPYIDERRLTVEEFLYAHFSHRVTEDDLAKKMNISKRQLSRILRQLFGTSFRQLLIDVRLNRAAQLLIETDASAEEIAAAVGYTSMSGFYSAFKDRFSISVGRYRKRFGKANT